MKRALVLSSMVIAVSCAGARPTPSPTPVVVVADAGPSASNVAWDTFVLPSFGRPLLAERDAEGNVSLVVGGMRARVRDERVEWSRDAVIGTLIAHARDGEQWYWASSDGSVYRSDGFLGALQRTGGLRGRSALVGFDSEGVLATMSDDHHLWLSDARNGFRAAPAPADGLLIDAGFVDARFGVAIVAPGQLFRTTDGGLHFDRVDFGAHAAIVVYPNGDHFVVDTTGGRFQLNANGAPTPFAGASGVAERAPGEEVVRQLQRNLTDGFAMAVPGLVASATSLGNQRFASTEGNDLVIRTPDGVEARIELPDGDCGVRPFGDGAIATCLARNATGLVLHRWEGSPSWTQLRRFEEEPRIVVDPAGTNIVAGGACEANAQTSGTASLCHFDGTSWRTITPSHRLLPLLLRRGVLLAEWFEDASPGTRHLVTLRLDTNVMSPIQLDANNYLRATMTDDGIVLAIQNRGSRRSMVMVRDGVRTVRPLPEGAIDADFATASRGLAVGPRLRDVWTTLDGGEHWTPLPLPIDGEGSGDLRAFVIDPDVVADESIVRCRSNYCVAGGRVLWTAPLRGANGAAIEPVRMLGPDSTPPEDDPPPLRRAAGGAFHPTAHGFDPTRFLCTSARPTTAPTQAVTSQQRLFGDSGFVNIGPGFDASSASGRVTFTWTGRDARGRFTVRAGPVSLMTLPASGGAISTDATLHLAAMTRTLLVLRRCPSEPSGGDCELLTVHPTAGLRSLGRLHTHLDYRANGDNDPTDVELRAAWPLADGGVLLHLVPDDLMASLAETDVLLRLDAHGAITARRGYAWSFEPTLRWPAMGPEGAGIVVNSAASPRSLVFHAMAPGSAPRVLGALPEGSASICNGAPDAQSTTVLFNVNGNDPVGRSMVLINSEPFGVAMQRPVLEMRSAGVCLREVRYQTRQRVDGYEQQLLDRLGGVPMLRARNGVMEAAVLTPTRENVSRCDAQQ